MSLVLIKQINLPNFSTRASSSQIWIDFLIFINSHGFYGIQKNLTDFIRFEWISIL